MTGEEIKDELYRMLSDVLNGNGPIRNNAQRGRYREAVKSAIEALEQKPICPSAGVDCEDCPAYEDAISRKAVLDVTWEEPSYTDALNVLTEVRDKVKALPPVNPQKPICPSAVLDKVRAEIEHVKDNPLFGMVSNDTMLEVILEIIDKFMAEEDKA